MASPTPWAPQPAPTESGSTAGDLAVLAQQFDAVDDPETLLHLIVARAHRLNPASGFAVLHCHGRANWVAAAAVDAESQRYAELHATFNHEFSITAPRAGDVGQSASSHLEVQGVHPNSQLAPYGVRFILIAPLGTPRRVYGTFNWYLGSEPDEELLRTARWFARHASLAYVHARERRDLDHAIDAMGCIGQAQGILMALSGVSAEDALTMMRRRSRRTHTTLSTIARRVINSSVGTVDRSTSCSPASGPPRPRAATELARALTWLESTAAMTTQARSDAVQDLILVLAAELDDHAEHQRADPGSDDLVADGLSRAADIVRDTALGIRADDGGR